MKIMHIAVVGEYNEGWLYQDNLLPIQNKLDGHEVVLVVSFKKHFAEEKVSEECYVNEAGVKVYRIGPPRWIAKKIQDKLRYFPKIAGLLRSEKPDVVFLHGVQQLTMFTVVRYKKQHPQVRLFADSHADEGNSATTFLSQWLLHRVFYRAIVRLTQKYFEKIFYVTVPRKDFLIKYYKLSENRLEFFPMGGMAPCAADYQANREKYRAEFGAQPGDVLFLHAGKFGPEKMTKEILSLFRGNDFPSAKLVLAGRFGDGSEIAQEQLPKNAVNLSWTAPKKLLEVMCACDVLLLPGRHSVLFEQGILHALVPVFQDDPHNRFLTSGQNGLLVRSTDDLPEAVKKLCQDKQVLETLKHNSLQFARRHLDYACTASRTLGI